MRAASARFSVQTSEERFSGQRQDRERTRRQEMLLGAAAVVALMPDRDDDAGLIVVPAMGRDAGALAEFRARAVGRDQQGGRNNAAVGQRHVDTIGMRLIAGNRGRPEIDATGLGVLDQRIDQMAVFDHMGERLARFDMAGKGQEDRPGGILELGIGDDHVEDRLRVGSDLAPDADRLEQPPAGGDDGGRARIAASDVSQARDRPR